MSNEREPSERLSPPTFEALKSELYMARYFLVAQAYNRVLEADELDKEDSNYYHLLDTDDEEMPVFLRDQTLSPEMYKALILSDKDVEYMGDDAVKLLVLLPKEYLIAENIDDVPESHQHIIIHRHERGGRTVTKVGVEGLRSHYWEDYEQEYEDELDRSNRGLGSKLLSNVIQLFNTEDKPPTAFATLDELDHELIKVELEKIRSLHEELENYVVWPQRRKKISQSGLFSD